MKTLYIMKSTNSNGSPHFSKYLAPYVENIFTDVDLHDIDVQGKYVADGANDYDLIIQQDVGGHNIIDLSDVTKPYKVLYATDPHGKFDYLNKFAPQYSYIFSAQQSYEDKFNISKDNQSWLPVAICPKQHYPIKTSNEYNVDIAFIGRCGQGTARNFVLAYLQYVCNKHSIKHGLFESWGTDYLELMARTKVSFNFHAMDDLNFRTFESLAMRKLLFQDWNMNGSAELFLDDIHLVYYTLQSLESKLLYYVNNFNSPEVQQIIANGHTEVLRFHTWDKRVAKMYHIISKKMDGV